MVSDLPTVRRLGNLQCSVRLVALTATDNLAGAVPIRRRLYAKVSSALLTAHIYLFMYLFARRCTVSTVQMSRFNGTSCTRRYICFYIYISSFCVCF